MASAAWRYIVNNTQSTTGLVNAVDNYPSTTLWDVASSIGGIISAERLAVIDEAEAIRRLRPMLATLQTVRLFRELCPNKVYDTAKAIAVDYGNKPGEIGCSALDVGRLLIWLRIIAQRYPVLEANVAATVTHLNTNSLVSVGILQGAAIDAAGKTIMLQEGRLGYEEYAARGFAMWGFDTGVAAKPQPYNLITLYDIPIPYDARDPRESGAHNYVVAEGAILDGVEFGWNEPTDTTTDTFSHRSGWGARVADNIYEVQAARYARTGVLTARTEHQLAGAPYFVYDTIFSDGQPWATITDTGAAFPSAAAVASKAAVGLWTLWNTPYTDRLMAEVLTLVDKDRGVAEGRLEQSGDVINKFTVNTNGIILESLAYKVVGKLHAAGPPLRRPVAGRAPPASKPPPKITQPSKAPVITTVKKQPASPDDPVITGAWRSPSTAGAPHPGRFGPLTETERTMASVAWRYIVNNTQSTTGLVNAVDNYPSTTLWDIASSIGGIISAERLAVIDEAEAVL